MTVAIVGEGWPTGRPGGLNRYVADLHTALTAAGADVGTLVVGPASDLPPGVGAVADANEPLRRRWAAIRAEARRRPLPDVVDVHFAAYGWPLVGRRGPWRDVPLVVHFHGPWADESRGLAGPRVKRRIERAVYRRARTVVTLSQAFADLVVERYGVDAGRVVVVPPAVDLARFSPGDRSAARTALGLPPRAFVAVAVRRLEARMGLDTLLDAWAEVQAARPDAVLVVAGDGSLATDLEARRRRLPRPDGVRLVGRVDDATLPVLYRAADCSVVPSHALEGFGLVVLESLACGTPAVVSAVGGLPEAVAGLDPTLVVPPRDAAALTRRLLDAADGALSDAPACRAHAEGYGPAALASRHLALYGTAARPHVVFVDHTAVLSGGELALARLLPALDVDARVVLGEDGPLVDRLAGTPVEVLDIARSTRTLRRDQVRLWRLAPGAAVGAARSVWSLARRLRALRPDLVHTNSLKAHLYGGAAGRLAGVPVVWHLRDRLATDSLPAPAVRLTRLGASLLPTHVIVNSRATLATLPRRAARRATVVHDGVDLDEIGAPARRDDPAPLRVGIVGRLAPWKGQDVFLRALAAVARDDVVPVVVGAAMFGDDAYAAGLRALADSMGLHVEWRGHVTDIGAEYHRLDVLVHASVVPEPFGQVVLEGMAAGLAVVATDAGGPAELVTAGVDGLLVPAGDVAAMAAAVASLVDDPALRHRLGAAARRAAEGRTMARTANEVRGVYAAVLSAARRR